jgi:DNA-binding NtrC family response regulator
MEIKMPAIDESQSSKFNIFIIEDNKLYADALKKHLHKNFNCLVSTFYNGTDALGRLKKEIPDFVTLDVTLPDAIGQELLGKIKKISPNICVIAISGQQEIDVAVKLLKEGAHDYLTKGTDTRERLCTIIRRINSANQLRLENMYLKDLVLEKYNFRKIIKGNSNEINSVFEVMQKAANSDITVLVNGETGTGKELVAKGIHMNSKRNGGPFILVNVSAIPKELIESELFGHEKGSFTGAYNKTIGKFELANNGTLFLDEIAELDFDLQSKLLRVLQEQEIMRIGGNKLIKLNTRIITATNKNLQKMVNEGAFRSDLFFRLYGLTINLPPLCERGNDLIVLSRHFLGNYCKENDLPFKPFSKEAIQKLKSYRFPGNIRELKSVIELACVLADGSLISEKDIKFAMLEDISPAFSSNKTLKEHTKEIVNKYIEKYSNIQAVAEKLDISRTTVYRIMKEK